MEIFTKGKEYQYSVNEHGIYNIDHKGVVCVMNEKEFNTTFIKQ